MSADSSKVQTILESFFLSAAGTLDAGEGGGMVNDLYVQADAETGELQLFDDGEELLDKVVVFDWVNSEEETFDRKAADALKAVLTEVTAGGAFDSPRFNRPFSVSLVDEEFTVLEELLFMDDDTLRIDDPLLKNLDEDLDNFINELLSDTPK